MKQYEAVIEVMKANGGYATLGHLYRTALEVPGVRWRTKTPFASIRRIVQDKRFFFKIKPGLWALNEYRDKIPFPVESKGGTREAEFTHAYYQGLLVEMGNAQNFETFVPHQDRNKCFLGTPLCKLTTAREFYRFSYERFVRCARTIDVTWFNERKMPHAFFEVEHSTNMVNALVKFAELRDFASEFTIVADKCRKRTFDEKLGLVAFRPVAARVRFVDYDTLSRIHARTFELSALRAS